MSLKIIALSTSEHRLKAIESLRERFSAANIIMKTRTVGLQDIRDECLNIKKTTELALYVLAFAEDELDAILELPLNHLGQGAVLVSDMDNTQTMRKVTMSGALDYVPLASVNPDLFDAIEIIAKHSRTTSKVVGFTGMGGGSGASTLAAFAAQQCAKELGLKTALVDFDLAFGRQGVDFSADSKGSYSRDFLADRPADNLMEGLYTSITDTFDIYANPNVLNLLDVEPMDNAGVFINALRDRYDLVFLDIPTALANFDAEALAYIDMLNLVFTTDLQAIRNLSNVLRWLDTMGAISFHPVLNKKTAKPNISLDDIKSLIKMSDISVFEDDPLFGQYQQRLDLDNRQEIKASRQNTKALMAWVKANALCPQRENANSWAISNVLQKIFSSHK